MKNLLKLLFATSVFFGTFVAQATTLNPDGSFDLFIIPMDDLADQKLTAKISFVTKDTCNTFTLSGDVFMVQEESNFHMGVYQILQTEIACNPGPERTIDLAAELPNLYDPGQSEVILMLPQGLTLDMEPIQ